MTAKARYAMAKFWFRMGVLATGHKFHGEKLLSYPALERLLMVYFDNLWLNRNRD